MTNKTNSALLDFGPGDIVRVHGTGMAYTVVEFCPGDDNFGLCRGRVQTAGQWRRDLTDIFYNRTSLVRCHD